VSRWPAALAAAGALAALAAGVVLDQSGLRAAEGSALAASSSPGPRGLAAARELWLATGVEARVRRRGDPASAAAVVLLAAPQAPLPRLEVEALLDRAAAGATVLVALGGAPQPALLEALGLALAPAGAPRTARALAPHPLVDGLALPARGAGLSVRRPGALPVAGGEGWASAVSVPAGRGEVLVLSGPEPLENTHLLEADAASLLVRLGRLGPLELDERFLAPAAQGTPPSQRALLLLGGQLLLAGAALAWARGRRLGAVRPPPPAGAGRTSRDYLAALATLYRRAGAEPELAARAWRGLRRRLERQAGIPARLPDAEAARRAQARSAGAALALARGSAELLAGGPGVLLRVTRAAAEAEAALRARRR
jgi:hypothetical protein